MGRPQLKILVSLEMQDTCTHASLQLSGWHLSGGRRKGDPRIKNYSRREILNLRISNNIDFIAATVTTIQVNGKLANWTRLLTQNMARSGTHDCHLTGQ